MPFSVRRLGSSIPFVLALLLLLPGPLACQDAEGESENGVVQEEMAVERESMSQDAGAADADGPLFSQKARELIDAQGPDAAIGELSMLLGTAREDYVMDVDGLIALGEEYQADGQPDAAVTATQMATFVDSESVDAVVALGDIYVAQENPTMAAVYYQQALGMDPAHPGARAGMEATGGALPEMPEREADAREADDAAAENEGGEDPEMSPEERRFEAMHEGPARDDLDRFKGQYHDPVEDRSYFISETCRDSGYLMGGPAWGDVAPWVLHSDSDLEFTQSNAFGDNEPYHLTFRTDPDGQVTGLILEHPEWGTTRLERSDEETPWDEPEGEECILQFM